MAIKEEIEMATKRTIEVGGMITCAIVFFTIGILLSAGVLDHNYTLLDKSKWQCTQPDTNAKVGEVVTCLTYERTK